MKKAMTRALALMLMLALILMISVIPGNVSASATTKNTSTENEVVTTENSQVILEGDSSLGNMLAAATSKEIDVQQTETCYITDIVVEDGRADISYQTDSDAEIVVAVYTEDTKQMVTSGNKEVYADSSTTSVWFDEELPEYFIIAAYMLDQDTHAPICKEFTCQTYTKEMQEFLAKTVDDYSEEDVLNLDDNSNTNFGVYSGDTVVVEADNATARDSEGTKVNDFTDNGNGTYTITNADSTFLSLKVGDAFSYTDSQGTVYLIKVLDIVIDGTTVTITQDTDADLTNFFDYMKIESNSFEGEKSVDNSDLGAGVTAVSAQARSLAYGEKLLVKIVHIMSIHRNLRVGLLIHR